MARLSISVEGWLGINHSYALVNQHQLLELKSFDIDLYHKNVPFHSTNWNAEKNYSGFTSDQHQALVDISNLDDEMTPDVIYRISSPYNYANANAKKIFVFGPPEHHFLTGLFTGANITDVITNEKFEFIAPSKWASQAFLKAGFPTDRVHIVSHGVDPQLFRVSEENRRSKYRSELGLNDDDFVLLSVSSLSWNKGQDILIRAFAKLRLKYKNLKLVIKDQHNLYGMNVIQFIEMYEKSPFPFNLTEEILNSIIFISANLSFDQLQGFYSASDCYVSPYRGEGFNLPALEAAACGVPVIVTRGGSTDDFFADLMGAQVESSTMSVDGVVYLEPNIDDLMMQIEKIFLQSRPSISKKNELSAKIREKYSWKKVTESLFKVLSST